MTKKTICNKALLLSALFAAVLQAQEADVIFVGDNILTMDDAGAEAIAIRGEIIIAAGDRAEVMVTRGEDTRVVELGEQALLPGFIDAHGHFSALSRYGDMLNLSSPPVGDVVSIEDLIRKIRLHIEQQDIPPGQLIYGFGYDDSLLAENRHPNRDDLDSASIRHPIIVRHVSGHLLATNSMGLEAAGVGETTQAPEGGVIRRRPGSLEPDGVMEETAMGLFPGAGELLSAERQSELRRETIDLYASYGITTIQDSNLPPAYVELLKQEALQEPFAADIVTYVMGNPLTDEQLQAVTRDAEYVGGIRNGGVKFTLDGSPQGRTAWMSEPYTEGPEGAEAEYVAYPSYDPAAWRRRIRMMIDRGVPVLAHANGDAAIELMIDGVEAVVSGAPVPDHRSVIIHAQLMRKDQLQRVAGLGIVPSFYSVHPFFWGDWHRISFGEERASYISPARDALDLGIPITIHNDAPVVPPDILRLVEIAVNRETRSGYVLGPDQRISIEEALWAVTRGAAYQYFEEDGKGSLSVGKRADLVVLAASPLAVAPGDLADIDIVETISRGRTIYQNPDYFADR